MMKLKKRGAMTAPWGTPALTGFGEEIDEETILRKTVLRKYNHPNRICG